jgi:hypothetical protein
VSRSWRDASSHAEDNEQLQLVLDLHNLGQADLDSSCSWLQLHGGCVIGLYINGFPTPCRPVIERLLVTPHNFGTHLTPLEVDGKDTLLDLAPHLQQLPALQHLGVCITFKVGEQPSQFSWAYSRRVWVLPDLNQLCPQLVSLLLTVDEVGMPRASGTTVSKQVFRLLPLGLQRLHLAVGLQVVDAANLTHLTALTHLTVDPLGLDNSLELMGMTRLQQLEVWQTWLRGMDLLPLASKLVGLWLCSEIIPHTKLSQLTGLTALACRVGSPTRQDPPPEVNPLLNLTSLRHLELGDTDLYSWPLEGLSSLSNLRSLTLIAEYEQQVQELVAPLTQLTALDVPMCVEGDCLDDRSSRVLQQLTGLQSLKINQPWLEACSRELGHLQQLTQLVVWQIKEEGHPLLTPEQLLAPLQGQCPSLKHVVYLCDRPVKDIMSSFGQPPEDVVPCPLPGVRLTLMAGSRPLVEGLVRPRPVRPCPHLPGVWELVTPVP